MNIKYISNKHIRLFAILFVCLLLIAINVYTNINNKYVSKEVFIDGIEEIDELYTDLLAKYETKFNEQNINRSENIKLAVAKINGTVILPGGTFSYNDIVGNRTQEAGFKPAPMYQGGELVEGIGGGVCQVSTTLYNASLYANLEIIERKNHQFLPGYIQVGRDATVADGYIDFKFRNTRKYPIKIECSAKNGILKVEIYGKKQDIEYDVEIQTSIREFIPYKTIYEYDNYMEKSKSVIVQSGKNGYECKTYKIISLNGKVISKVIISTDIYNVKNEIVRIGLK